MTTRPTLRPARALDPRRGVDRGRLMFAARRGDDDARARLAHAKLPTTEVETPGVVVGDPAGPAA